MGSSRKDAAFGVGMAVLGALVLQVVLPGGSGSAATRRPNITPDVAARAADLVRDGELHEAARLVGRVLDRRRLPGWTIESFDELAERSSDILVGTFDVGRGHLVPGANYVTSEYDFTIDAVLKGARQQGTNAKISIIGGKVMIDADRWVETRLETFFPPLQGERFVVFATPTRSPIDPRIRERSRPYPVLGLVNYRNGLLRIGTTGIIEPRAESAGVTKGVIGEAADEIVRRVREAVKTSSY